MAYRRSISASAWLLTAALACAGCASAGEDDVDGSIGGGQGRVAGGCGTVDSGGNRNPAAADVHSHVVAATARGRGPSFGLEE